ncbi:DUF7544 domain-containing protein [Halarchaeum sp. P4]|uniref:DUF7544 domain-containing protein n=1 Tax=Halarchaeum sp. P4 TaxID=3421639 RepID=UPI003EBC9259
MSSWYAVAVLRRAYAETSDLLRPVTPAVWARLALLALFAGGASVRPPGVGLGSVPLNVASAPSLHPAFDTPRTLAFLATAAVLVVLLGVLASACEFALVTFVEERGTPILPAVGRALGPGLRLFGFRLVLGAVVVVPLVALLTGVIGAASAGSITGLLVALVFVPVVGGLVLAVLLVSALTSSFVVPLMHREGYGVLEGWRALQPALVADAEQVAVYVLVRVCLGIAYAVAASVVVGAFVLPFAAAYGLTVVGGQAGFLAGVAALLVAAVGSVVFLVCVRGPATAYLRYHSLLVLDATNAPYAFREE